MSLCRKLLNVIMGSLDEGLMVLLIGTKRPSTVVFINPQFTEIYGYTLGEIQDAQSNSLYTMSDDPAGVDKIIQAVHGRVPLVLEMRCLRKDGSHFTARVSLNFSIKPDGSNDYLVIRTRDISLERKAYDELIESNVTLLSKNNELESLSTHDCLTDTYNRRFFDSHIERLCGFHIRHQMPMCVAFIDIDYYKQYNDLYGHIAGDNVLKIIAQEMKKTFLRLEDITARYGGDEFVIVSPGASDEAVALEHFDGLRKRVEALAIPNKYSPCGGIITLSIGIFVGVPEESFTAERILMAADEALYAAKHAGRNTTVVYDPSIHSLSAPMRLKNQEM